MSTPSKPSDVAAEAGKPLNWLRARTVPDGLGVTFCCDSCGASERAVMTAETGLLLTALSQQMAHFACIHALCEGRTQRAAGKS